MFLGGSNTEVYKTPVEKMSVATSTIVVKSLSTSTPERKTDLQKTKPLATTTKTKISKKIIKNETKQVTTTPKVEVKKEEIPLPSFEQINEYAREALVNILCTTKTSDLSPISGTGVVVRPDGLILTNAHIAQYFLLKDWKEKDFIQCVIRTGSPAYPRYNAELVYISPTWVGSNNRILFEQNPKGTGENDFAFIRITSNIDGSKLPEKFSFIHMNVRENIERNEPVLLVSYPAGFLGGLAILQNLNIASSITGIQELFTFKEGPTDLISVGGTVVSQKGSSGGAVVDKYATLLGVISTSSDDATTGKRYLGAITLAYINRAMQSELGINLAQFADGDINTFTKKFQEINVPTLTKLITDELKKASN